RRSRDRNAPSLSRRTRPMARDHGRWSLRASATCWNGPPAELPAAFLITTFASAGDSVPCTTSALADAATASAPSTRLSKDARARARKGGFAVFIVGTPGLQACGAKALAGRKA